MTKTENTIPAALRILNKLDTEKIATDTDLHIFVNDVFEEVVDAFVKKFLDGKTDNTTMEQYEDMACFAINVAETLIATSLMAYAHDCIDTTYNLPSEQSNKLKKYLSKIVYNNSGMVLNEMFAWLFNLSFHNSIITAQKHRKMVEEEIAAKKNIKN